MKVFQIRKEPGKDGQVPQRRSELAVSSQVRTLGSQVRLDARTKLLNPKWYEGMLSSGYEGVREIQKRLTNTMGWSATSGQVHSPQVLVSGRRSPLECCYVRLWKAQPQKRVKVEWAFCYSWMERNPEPVLTDGGFLSRGLSVTIHILDPSLHLSFSRPKFGSRDTRRI